MCEHEPIPLPVPLATGEAHAGRRVWHADVERKRVRHTPPVAGACTGACGTLLLFDGGVPPAPASRCHAEEAGAVAALRAHLDWTDAYHAEALRNAAAARARLDAPKEAA